MAGTHRATPAPAVRQGTSHGKGPSTATRAASATYSTAREGSLPRGAQGNMLAILVTSTGVILFYSALRNIAVSLFIRDLIAGKNPAKDVGTGPYPIGPTVTVTGGFSDTAVQQVINDVPPGKTGKPSPTSSGPAIAGPISHTFETVVLKAIGAPLTQANYNFLTAWSGREKTAARNNPLATTYRVPGSTSLAGNKSGVQNYASEAIGAVATAKTLLNGLYGDILKALRSGHPSLTATYPGLSKWSNGGYSRVVG